MWVFDVQLFQCVCRPWEYLDSEPSVCICQIPSFQVNEESESGCFCNICCYLRCLELSRKEGKPQAVSSEDRQKQHFMECVCPVCARESKIVAISDPKPVSGYSSQIDMFHTVPQQPARVAQYDRGIATSRLKSVDILTLAVMCTDHSSFVRLFAALDLGSL